MITRYIKLNIYYEYNVVLVYYEHSVLYVCIDYSMIGLRLYCDRSSIVIMYDICCIVYHNIVQYHML